ncbi:M56 family metallopeptidase [Wukongibacter baidiensis]|uniref:M56 family metallopeptidase n=1 Tax=Wukongibacter baidiensis TaxID=1723361 RepID=UPI003D7FEE6F
MEYREIFYWVINSSIKGSLLVIGILLIKLLFREKLGAKWHYYIWLLLLTRLVIPVAPQSSISIFNLFNIVSKDRGILKNNVQYSTDEIVSWFRFKLYEEPLAQSGALSANETGLSKYLSILLEDSIQAKLMLTWIVVAIALLTFIIIANVRFRLKVNSSEQKVSDGTRQLIELCKSKMGIKSNLQTIHTNAVKSPALYGLIRPCILLPIDIHSQVDEKELEYIILHELSHFKRKDIAVFWIMTILKAIYWFNPIIWYGLGQMREDCEVSCDALALSYIDLEDFKKYGQTIIRLLQNTTKPLKNIGVTGMLGTKQQLKRRIKMITLFRKNRYKLSILSITILILMGFVFLTNAKESAILENAIKVDVSQVEDIKGEANKAEGILTDETSKIMIWPLSASTTITSSYGMKKHPTLNVEKKHTGIDIAGKKGDSIVAAADGTVTLSEDLGGYGKSIIIDHGNGVVSLYAHCSELVAEKDKKVKAGDEIAKVGSTGWSTAPHLHFEIRKEGKDVDPFDGYLDKKYNEPKREN